jgi:acyl-CoA dehydrogenase
MIAAQSLFNAILANNEKPPVISAIMKYKFTEYGRIAVNNGMDILGGAGICKGSMNFLASSYVATPVAITVEGSNTLTRSLIIFGQGLNRSHPHLLNIITSIENNDKKSFGEHFNKIVYHTLNNMVKSVYYGIYLKIYKNKIDVSQYHENHLNRHVANFAFTANMGLLMGGKIKTAEYISGRYADMLANIYMSYACLWYYKQHKDIKDIDKILNYSLNDYYCNIENNMERIAANFPIKIIGGLMKIITYPMGKQYSHNNDKLTTIISNAITTPTELRKVLTENVYISENEDDRIRQICDGFEICHDVDRLVKKGADCDILKINRANELRAKIIKVNEYAPAEL